MQVFAFSSLEELEPYADAWDRLAGGAPLRSWTWLSSWWRHYRSPRTRLLVLGVFDHADFLVAAAPWFLDDAGPGRRVIRPLGSGEVCSDYVGILSRPDVEAPVIETLADFLAPTEADNPSMPAWDMLQLDGVAAADGLACGLVARLAERGCATHRRATPSCWRIELPSSWEAYLAGLSKGHRKQIRRLERELLDTGRAVLHTVQRGEDLPQAAALLIDLHQRRRRGLGQRGCFASPRFAAFHREVMPAMLAQGQLQLHWLELDGRPAAAEYHLAGGGVIYAYQSGIDPARLDAEPGRLITAALLRRAIRQGFSAYDFLRGDEPYKAHFRAAPRPMLTLRAVAGRPLARLRHTLWLAVANVKQWIA